MSVPWELVGTLLGSIGAAVVAAASVWFTQTRTTAKLKALKEVDVHLRNGEHFTAKCVDMVKVGARNYLKFDVRDSEASRERLIPNDEIAGLRTTRRTPKSPRERLEDTRAWSAKKFRDIQAKPIWRRGK